MKICLVNYEQGMGIDGILTKYARLLGRELQDLGHTVTISDKPQKADVNHHLNYISYQKSGGKDTTMITHLTGDKNQTEQEKIELIKKQSKTAIGICMDQCVLDKLVKAGVPKSKLALAGHAHDGFARRPRIIAIVTNLYPDGRKREQMFIDLFRSFKDKKAFIFRIMGKDWMPVLDPLSKEGLQVQWADKFTADLYQQFLNTSDYLLYTGGEDSLAQSLIDSINAGLKVIAPPKDSLPIDLPFKNQKELNEIFRKMTENPVADWTWSSLAKKHEQIWKKSK